MPATSSAPTTASLKTRVKSTFWKGKIKLGTQTRGSSTLWTIAQTPTWSRSDPGKSAKAELRATPGPRDSTSLDNTTNPWSISIPKTASSNIGTKSFSDSLWTLLTQRKYSIGIPSGSSKTLWKRRTCYLPPKSTFIRELSSRKLNPSMTGLPKPFIRLYMR